MYIYCIYACAYIYIYMYIYIYIYTYILNIYILNSIPWEQYTC